MPKVTRTVQHPIKITLSIPHPHYEDESQKVHLYFEAAGCRIDRGTGWVFIPKSFYGDVADEFAEQAREEGG